MGVPGVPLSSQTTLAAEAEMLQGGAFEQVGGGVMLITELVQAGSSLSLTVKVNGPEEIRKGPRVVV